MTRLDKLAQYHYNQEDESTILFDQYGRPYIQNNGKMMLSRKTTYEYSIKN